MSRTVLVLNGPNLNMLGTREPATYGHETLADVCALCARTAVEHDLVVEFRQSNHEGEAINWIHQARGRCAAIVINPGAWTHTSIAIRDALTASDVPVIEVHISNVHARESFRHHSYISGMAVAVLCGFGTHGYRLALEHVGHLLNKKG